MTKLNISQASKAFGKDWKTVDSKCKKGVLSYTKDERGNRVIDVTELIRVFGEPKNDSIPVSIGNGQEIPEHSTVDSTSNSISIINELREQIKTLREDKEDLREERDRLLKMLEAEQEKTKVLMLEDKRNTSEEQPKAIQELQSWVKAIAVITALSVLIWGLSAIGFSLDFLK